MVHSITEIWGYDREFCSSSSSTRTSQKPYNIESCNLVHINIPKRLHILKILYIIKLTINYKK